MKFYISFVGKVRSIRSGGERKCDIAMIFRNMEIVYRNIKYAFKCRLTFSMLLASIENSHFHFRPPWSWKTDPPVDQSKFFQPITHVKKLQRLHVMLSLHFPALLNNQRKRDTCETLDT